MTTLIGWTCAYCGGWVNPTDVHWCPQMNPNQPEQHHHHYGDPSDLKRIADALERIALALEKPSS